MFYKPIIEPTQHTLDSIRGISENFSREGLKRVVSAVLMKGYDVDDLERLTIYVIDSVAKMKRERVFFDRFKADYISRFATEFNGYFKLIQEELKHLRSHIATLKQLMTRFCPPNHPNKEECRKYGIEAKDSLAVSALAQTTYQPDMFGIESCPPQVSALYNELKEFFGMMKDCIDECELLIAKEEQLRNNPLACEYILDRYFEDYDRRCGNMASRMTRNTVEALMETNPTYKASKNYADKQAFAQNEYHKHSVVDMDDFCLIEINNAKTGNNISDAEYALWKDNIDTITKVRLVVGDFDTLLPEKSAKQKGIGTLYVYAFCKWAKGDNVKAVLEYFRENYRGTKITSVPKYSTVSSQSAAYAKSDMKKQFAEGVQQLLEHADDVEQRSEQL